MYRKFSYNLIMICFVIILFQEYLQIIIPVLGYFDEVLAITMFIYWIYSIIKSNKVLQYEKQCIVLIVLISFIGLLSNYTSGITQPFVAIIFDIFSCFKMFMIFFGGYRFLIKVNDETKKSMIRKMAFLTRIIVLIAFICMILNIILPNGFSRVEGEYRYGLYAFGFIYSGPAYLNMYVYDYIAILTMDINAEPKRKQRNYFFIILTIIIWVSTLRSRAFAYSFLYVACFYLIMIKKKRKTRNSIKKRYIVYGLGAAVLISYNMILNYFVTGVKQARYILLRMAVQMIKDYLPFGTGFATFGTNAALIWYSSVYSKYGVDNTFGLSKSHPDYIFDNYWPSIFGQFGLFGGLLMAILIFCVFKFIIQQCRNDKGAFLTAIIVTICICLSSVATASFYSYTGCGLLFLSLLVVTQNNNNNNT